jgi:hypothetical protein
LREDARLFMGGRLKGGHDDEVRTGLRGP